MAASVSMNHGMLGIGQGSSRIIKHLSNFLGSLHLPISYSLLRTPLYSIMNQIISATFCIVNGDEARYDIIGAMNPMEHRHSFNLVGQLSIISTPVSFFPAGAILLSLKCSSNKSVLPRERYYSALCSLLIWHCFPHYAGLSVKFFLFSPAPSSQNKTSRCLSMSSAAGRPLLCAAFSLSLLV